MEHTVPKTLSTQQATCDPRNILCLDSDVAAEACSSIDRPKLQAQERNKTEPKPCHCSSSRRGAHEPYIQVGAANAQRRGRCSPRTLISKLIYVPQVSTPFSHSRRCYCSTAQWIRAASKVAVD
jgi:hypothetical protein